MARIRSIKPEFWTSEQIVACSIPARLLFLGLWNFVDDGGRIPLSIKRIKMQIYPADDFSSTDIRRMLDELSSNVLGEPLVVTYSVAGKEFLQITGWKKHQKIDRPTYQYPDQTGVIPASPANKGPDGKFTRRALDDRSPPESSREERKGVEGSRVEGSRVEGNPPSRLRERDARARARGGDFKFDDDWPNDYRQQFADAYPHKVDMAKALLALDAARLKNPHPTWSFMMAQVVSYAANKPPDRQWANPKTWIEGERWNDQPAPTNGANGKHGQSSADRARELARQVEAREREGASSGQAEAVGGAELGGDNARSVPGRT